MAVRISTRVEGVEKAAAQLRALPKRLAKKALRKVAGDGAKRVLWAAKPAAKEFARTGLLGKSLGRKVKSYQGGLVQVGIVGARKEFRQVIGTRKRDSGPRAKRQQKAGEPVYADPSKYVHLVELGTKRSRAYHFLERAKDQVAPAVQSEAVATLNDAIAEALSR